VSLGGRAAYFWPTGSGAGNGNWFGGAQLRVYLANFFAVEASADYRQQRVNSNNTINDVYPVQASGLLYLLPNSPVSPYLLGGMGWYFTRTRGPAGFSQTNNSVGAHVGAGLQCFLSRHWSIDGSYRYIFVNNINTTQNGAAVTISNRGHMATGGLNFHF
jgi:opacity protein-like surface antigen